MMTLLTSARGAALFSVELRESPVVIQSRHRGETVRRQRGCVALSDQRIRIGRIAHHQHPHVAARDRVQRLALRRENLCVLEQQILALHAGSARPRADQHGVIAVLECDAGIGARRHLVEGGECAVVELHHHALHRRARRRDLEQIQVDRLVGAQHLTRCDAKGERITDVTRGARDGDSDRLLHEIPRRKSREF